MPTQAVDRALRILETIAESGRALSLSEVSARTGLHVSTAHRLIATLRDRGFVEQVEGSGHYRIGPCAFRVGRSFLEGFSLGPHLRPVLAELAADTRETANLVIRYGLEAIYLDHVIGAQVAKLFTEVGQRVPLHCTAVGKVLLAYASDVRAVLPHLTLTRFTAQTITTPAALERELAAVRARGYAVDREEHEAGVACLAAPVLTDDGAIVAAVGISGPSGRVLPRAGKLGERVRAAGEAASRLLRGSTPDVSARGRRPR
ncbi:MAG: IclR family transcriptional regulator [Armatimonadota bacterium]|nr:IclR family transcriptional regulator [Armatimonadota bacterium]